MSKVTITEVVEGVWRVGIRNIGGRTFNDFKDATHAYELLKAQEREYGRARLDSIRNIGSVI